MSARDAQIAPTAYYTAYVWHRLRLPNAEIFATPKGRRLFYTLRILGEWVALVLPRVPSMVQYLEARHRAIDHALDINPPDRIIELGAGLSRRGLTWAARGVPYIEVDLPHMVDAKRSWIADRAPAALLAQVDGRLTHEVHDILAPGFRDWLAGALAGAERPVVIAEGVLGYFAIPERVALATSIAAALPPGGRFLCDLRATDGSWAMAAAVRFLKAMIWVATSGRGTRADFTTEAEVRTFFASADFPSAAVIPVRDAAPHLAHLRMAVEVWQGVR